MLTPLPSPLPLLDVAFVVLIAVTFPLGTWWLDRRERALGLDLPPAEYDRMSSYRTTMILLWVPTLAVLIHWFVAGRSPVDLGLGLPQGPWGWLTTGAVVLICGLLLRQMRTVDTRAEVRGEVVEQLASMPDVLRMLPHTPVEWSRFRLVAMTAGITEEILFRGFLVVALAAWMPLPLAAVVSLGSFTAAHAYQRSGSAIVRVGAMGAVLTGVVFASGSLIPAIVLHAMIDLSSGGASYHALRDRGGEAVAGTTDEPEPEPELEPERDDSGGDADAERA